MLLLLCHQNVDFKIVFICEKGIYYLTISRKDFGVILSMIKSHWRRTVTSSSENDSSGFCMGDKPQWHIVGMGHVDGQSKRENHLGGYGKTT